MNARFFNNETETANGYHQQIHHVWKITRTTVGHMNVIGGRKGFINVNEHNFLLRTKTKYKGLLLECASRPTLISLMRWYL